MKKKHIYIGLTFLVIFMAACGLFYNMMFTDVIWLKSWDNPNGHRYFDNRIFQVWLAKHPIQKGQIITVEDFEIGEIRESRISQEIVTVWLNRIKWTAAKDFKKGEILKESGMKPKDPNELMNYLETGIKPNPYEYRRTKYLRWIKELEEIVKPEKKYLDK